jgi:ATP-dependent Clp protease ATP-binding subunit ClpB
MEAARRAGDLARMAELQYGKIPELEARIAATGEHRAETEIHLAAQQRHRRRNR